MNYCTGTHTKQKLIYHLVWIPKLKMRLLQGNIAKRIEEILHQCAKLNGWRIDKLSIEPDHIHILVQLKANISVSKAVQLLKDGSSKIVRNEYPQLEEFLWGDSFWEDGYFAETVGQINREKIRSYVQKE